jgi:hypothetical protein
MMQGTGAAFQAQVSLNQQATDPMSHTPVQSYANLSGSYSLPAKSDGRPPSCSLFMKPSSWGIVGEGNIAVFFRFQIFLGSYRGQFFTMDILGSVAK